MKKCYTVANNQSPRWASSFALIFMSPHVELVEVLKNVDENIVKWFIHQSTSLVVMGNMTRLVLRINNSWNVPPIKASKFTEIDLYGSNNLVGIREEEVYIYTLW